MKNEKKISLKLYYLNFKTKTSDSKAKYKGQQKLPN